MKKFVVGWVEYIERKEWEERGKDKEGKIKREKIFHSLGVPLPVDTPTVAASKCGHFQNYNNGSHRVIKHDCEMYSGKWREALQTKYSDNHQVTNEIWWRENFTKISDSLKLTYPYDRMVVWIMMLRHTIAKPGVSRPHQNHSAIERLLCRSIAPYFFPYCWDPRLWWIFSISFCCFFFCF